MTTSKTTTDFTKGNIYSELLTLAAPLILGNILQQFYNTIDAFVVGKFAGTEEFAAIGIAGTIMNLFLFILIGACSGLSVLFARFYGTRDYSMLQKQHFTALTLGLTFSIVLGACGLLCMHPLLAAIRTPAELTGYVSIYLRFIFLSLPAAFLYNLYASALRASGDTKTAFFILAAAVFTNLILDIALVAYGKQGICGAAAATACTQILSAALCFFYLAHSHKEFLFSRKECTFDRSLMKLTVQYSLATAIHQASLYIGKLLVQGIVNSAGTDAISAYTAATRIEGFANSFGDSGSAASSVLISQNYGAKKTKRIQETFRKSLFITAAAGLLCAAFLYAGARPAVSLMLGAADGAAYRSAVHYLKLISFFYLFCFTGGAFTGFYNGTGRVIVTVIGSLGQITLRVILSGLLFPALSLNAVAAATGLGWICANLFWLAIRYLWLAKSRRIHYC